MPSTVQRVVSMLAAVAGLSAGHSMLVNREAAVKLEQATGMRVLAMSNSVVVVEKPAGLRSVPAYGPTDALRIEFETRLGAGEDEAVLRTEFERSNRRDRWCKVAAAQEWLNPKLRSRADSLPRTKTKFLKVAVGKVGKMTEEDAQAAWEGLRAAVEAAEAAEGLEESDSVLRRIKRAGFVDACPVHRLDVSTSGILAVALNPAGAAHLCEQWRTRVVEKRYEALVGGVVLQDSGEITIKLQRKDAVRRQGDASRMTAVSDEDALIASTVELNAETDNMNPILECHTSFTVLQRFSDSTHLELVPHTGRLHQLRAHLFSVDHAILGDSLYGGFEQRAKRLCLHASQLELTDPDTLENWVVSCPTSWTMDDVIEPGDAGIATP
ncbi:pseudouridine synthase [Pelagophyceae sp. CCMP2097]|nr:pseudouridine synthase [Pelagophyceae sp. CCMP2097]